MRISRGAVESTEEAATVMTTATLATAVVLVAMTAALRTRSSFQGWPSKPKVTRRAAPSNARLLSMGVRWMILVLTGAMVLDHLQVGGNIVELAFGILFGGIVLTLALAVGLGSRDLVSRSLESRVEHVGDRTSIPDDSTTASRTIRHF